MAVLASLRRQLLRLAVQAQRLRLDRLLLVGAVVGAIVLVLVETPVMVTAGAPVVLAFVLSVAHAGAVPMALRRPNLAAIGALIAALLLQLLTSGSTGAWPWAPVLIVTQCLVLAAVSTRTTLTPALVHWVLAVAFSAMLAAALRPDDSARTSIDLVVFGSIAAADIVVVLLLTQWRRVRVQLLTERRLVAEESAARLIAEERTLIARELHDVVAHSLSIITVQASTARFRNHGVDAESAAEFDRIAAQSRQALDEMRGLLRVLRGTDEGAERAPQPGLDDVAALVAQVAATGTEVTLSQPPAGWSDGIGPVTGLAAFRIVQEATSNALRHAPGTAVSVRLERHRGEIEIAVVNTRATDAVVPPVPAVRGHGLIGMRERASSVGGSIDFRGTADGGFAVSARLPVAAAAGAEP